VDLASFLTRKDRSLSPYKRQKIFEVPGTPNYCLNGKPVFGPKVTQMQQGANKTETGEGTAVREGFILVQHNAADG